MTLSLKKLRYVIFGAEVAAQLSYGGGRLLPFG